MGSARSAQTCILLSHRLHSSTLDTLGLIAGAKAFSQSSRSNKGYGSILQLRMSRVMFHRIRLCVFFASSRRDSEISNGTAVPIGREFVWNVQERNCNRQLLIRGRGFDVNNRSPRSGIGIHSMEERLRLLGGQLSITSHAMHGTKIDAWLPLRVPGKSVA